VYTQYYVVKANGKGGGAAPGSALGSDSGPGESGLYNRIAVLRTERGISRQDLADAVGVNYQTIGFLERGAYGPSLKLAFSIAEYFSLPIEAIFSTRPFRPLSEQVYGSSPREVRKEKVG
jgi:putative transcriptional regulator